MSKIRVLSDVELAGCLEVKAEKVMEHLQKEVSCVTCRKAAKLRVFPGPNSLARVVSPINVDEDGYVRLNDELIYVGLVHLIYHAHFS